MNELAKTFYNIDGVPFVLKARVFLREQERKNLLDEINRQKDSGVILVPDCIDVIPIEEPPGRWIDKKDLDYSGGGYTACSVCGQRYAWGAYHEPQEFRYCPRCGHQMEVEEDE